MEALGLFPLQLQALGLFPHLGDSRRHLGYSAFLGAYVSLAGDTCVTLTAPGDTYVTSAAAAALDICVTPTAAGGT